MVVRNEVVWFVGADNGSTGYEVILQQRDMTTGVLTYHPLFKIEPGGDATAIGMMTATLDMHSFVGAQCRHTLSDPRV